MITGFDCRSDFFRYEYGSHRQATREGLGEGEHVGNDTCVLIREEVSGASEAALYLVENESDLPFRGQLAESLQEIRIENANPSFALNRLDDHRCDRFLIESSLEVGKVPLANRYPARQRTEGRAIGRTVRCGQ